MLRIGCQTYTWEMLGERWTGTADELLGSIAAGGYSGIEITNKMIGSYAARPKAFAEALKTHGLDLIAFAWASDSGFTEPAAFDADLAAAERVLDFVAQFPGAVLSLGSATIMSAGDKAGKFAAAARIYNAIGALGQRMDVDVAFHPSSHHNTLLGTGDEYARIMALTDGAVIGWVPDTGHILRGGMTLVETVTLYRDRVRYLHLKDVDSRGHWQMLGEGVCDTRAVVEAVSSAPRFNGWIVAEEESDVAAADPGTAVRRNRETLRQLLG